ncbi:phage Gp37/Gp68 family protein [Sphingobium sp. AS12]|uniref:phage Gp37/Gp68 family protein n=1 Tax=Sphingobium sp. AS12 TaxID=2849495 RepID=UPI001C31BB22|nr:phage Gp37/Gp68 family protein [Sphingobium sp. AS12]MBV2148591.1 phage Gp37/Gp68 family protein [Sphingobium sp. AS12]
MSDGTHIEWTDATVNAINGCTVLSPGCTNCYAMRLAGTRLRDHPSRVGLTSDSKAGPVWNGTVRLNESALLQPLRWKRPRRIFWNAHGDIFHPSVTDAWIDRCFAVMALTPHHIHQVLTKRSDRMRTYLSSGAANRRIARVIIDWLVDGTITKGLRHCATWPVRSIGDIDDPTDITVDLPLPNVWLGVSVEDQIRADERIPDLLATPAAVRWLSCEPLLGLIDFAEVPAERGSRSRPIFGPLSGYCLRHYPRSRCGCAKQQPAIDWVVVGGESGPGARPMHPDWARDLRDQCAAAQVPFFFKQWGDWTPGENVQRQSGWVNGAHWFDNRWLFEEQNLSATDGHIDDEPDLYRVGKRTAGRLLDGVQHDGMPG